MDCNGYRGETVEHDLLSTLSPVTTPQEMREWDAMSIRRFGVPGIVLMENAAQQARIVLQSYVPDLAGKQCALLMGAGNNGGDAACLARMLLDLGALPTVYNTKPADGASDAGFYTRVALACGVPFKPASEFDGRCDILVDGLLGTGFTGELREDMLALVRRCNGTPRLFTLGLDIPSGLSAMTGQPHPDAVRCDATATFAAAKPGLLMPSARPYTGNVHVCYIGTPKKSIEAVGASFAELTDDALRLLPDTLCAGYKNSYGHVVVIGGAHGLSGAAHIAALAALRAGAGLVTAVAPSSETGHVKGGRAELMTRGLGRRDTEDWPDAVSDDLQELLSRAGALVVGPGMGRGADAAAFLTALLRNRETLLKPGTGLVLDADALTLMGARPELAQYVTECDILTPHPGEARSLLGGVQPAARVDVIKTVRERYHGTIVLKGDGTLVLGRTGPCLIYGEDVPQLSCGGSGDCLAGVAGALLARTLTPVTAAALAVVWHGAAGKAIAERWPERGNLASELADALPLAAAKARARFAERSAS